jgi:hypothetical protein
LEEEKKRVMNERMKGREMSGMRRRVRVRRGYKVGEKEDSIGDFQKRDS